MNNISLNKESIDLDLNEQYVIIDGLYLSYIKRELKNLNLVNLMEEIKIKVFPYLETPFVVYSPVQVTFDIQKIKKVNYAEISSSVSSVFSSDTGLLLFINKNLFIDFLCKYDYEKLIDSLNENINIEFWKSIIGGYPSNNFALILSPGIGSSIDFDGSGLFQIQ